MVVGSAAIIFRVLEKLLVTKLNKKEPPKRHIVNNWGILNRSSTPPSTTPSGSLNFVSAFGLSRCANECHFKKAVVEYVVKMEERRSQDVPITIVFRLVGVGSVEGEKFVISASMVAASGV